MRPKVTKLLRKRLDGAGVEAHFDWVAEQGQEIEIQIKGAPTAYSESAAIELKEVGRQLRAGEIIAVQLRYLHNGDWWRDTVIRAGDTYRLVRQPDPFNE